MSDESNAKITCKAPGDWNPCPFCGTRVSVVETAEAFRYAGSIHFSTVVIMKCDCFQENWTHGDYGTAERIHADSKAVWNRRFSP